MKVIKNKAFRILVLTTMISSLGDSLYLLAITLSVYNISGSILGVAGMWLIRALIRIPCQFFSGIIVDKFNRKKISIYVYLLSAILLFLFACINTKYIIIAFVFIFILQAMSDVDNMAQDAIISEVIEEEQLVEANSIFEILGNATMLIGPGIGGILYTMTGTSILYIIDAITFIVAATILLLLPYTYQKDDVKIKKFQLIKFAREGVVELKKVPVIKIMMITTLIFSILGRFYEIDKIYVADKILNIGAQGIVWFSYAMALGGFLAPAVSFFLNKTKWSDITKFSVLSMLWSCSFVLWGNASVFTLSIFTNILLGIFETSSSIFISVIFQSKINKGIIGRVMSFYKIISVICAVIGILLAPILTKFIGVGTSMGLVGMLAMLFCGILIRSESVEKNGTV